MRVATSSAQAKQVAASTTKSQRNPRPDTAAATSPARMPATASEALSAE